MEQKVSTSINTTLYNLLAQNKHAQRYDMYSQFATETQAAAAELKAVACVSFKRKIQVNNSNDELGFLMPSKIA